MRNLLCAAVLVAVSAMPAAAQESKQDFVLVNKTGYELDKVFVSPGHQDDWEDDVLGKDTLDDGERVEITFHRSEKTCKWDLKVVYSVDNSSAVWSDIDLCTVSKVTIRYNESTEKTTATFD